MSEKNFGILTSVDWNSNKWQAYATPQDISNSNFSFVNENGTTYTSLNFGHAIFPTDSSNYYHGLLPQLTSRMPIEENSKFVEIIFIRSFNWENKQNYIIGFYAFPIIKLDKMASPISEITGDFIVNVKAFPENIHLLENYINLTSSTDLKKFLPKGNGLGKMGYNYLKKVNVYKILDAMQILNPTDKKLIGLKIKLIQSIEKR